MIEEVLFKCTLVVKFIMLDLLGLFFLLLFVLYKDFYAMLLLIALLFSACEKGNRWVKQRERGKRD